MSCDKAMVRQYFELCIGPGPKNRPEDYWMCVCGVREPTIPEAEQFYAVDVLRNGGHVLGLYPIDRETAESCYDFSREECWPVFGLRQVGDPLMRRVQHEQ